MHGCTSAPEAAAQWMLQAAVSLCYDLRCKEREVRREREERERERTGACELRNCKTEKTVERLGSFFLS
jgi:hypothetical protein